MKFVRILLLTSMLVHFASGQDRYVRQLRLISTSIGADTGYFWRNNDTLFFMTSSGVKKISLSGANMQFDTLKVLKSLGLELGTSIFTSKYGTSSSYGVFYADTTIASFTREYNSDLQTILKAMWGAIYAPVGFTFSLAPFRIYSSFYLSDAVTDYSTNRPYLESTQPHGLFHINRYGPYSYAPSDDIAAAKMRMIHNSNLSTQPNQVGGALGVMDVGSSHPAGIYSSGGSYVPNFAYGIGGNVNTYAGVKTPLGAGGVFQVNAFSGAGFRRGMNIYTPRPVGAANDTTVGWYYQSPGSISGARFAAILEDSGKIAWSDVMLYRSEESTLSIEGSVRIGANVTTKIDSVVEADGKLFFYIGSTRYVAFPE